MALIDSWASTFSTCYIAVITDVTAVAKVRVRTSSDAGVVASQIVGHSRHILAGATVREVVDTRLAGLVADRTGEAGRQLEVVGQHAVVESALVEQRVLVVDLRSVGWVSSAFCTLVAA